MARYAVVDSNGLVVNLIEWDGQAAWSPPNGCTAVEDTLGYVGLGWTCADGIFTDPNPIPGDGLTFSGEPA